MRNFWAASYPFPPGKIICVGMNYPMPGQPPAHLPYPVLFLKAASTIIGPEEPIVLPKDSKRVFCEAEVAVVIGRQGKHIPKAQAWDYVAGLTIANDVGAADLENRTSQWQTGKLPDTFLPLSACLTPLDHIPDLGALDIELRINDVPRLRGNTADMLFDIPTLIAYVSGLSTLYPGDLLLTGSPKGLGAQPASRAFVQAGDQVTIRISHLGMLGNSVIEEEEA